MTTFSNRGCRSNRGRWLALFVFLPLLFAPPLVAGKASAEKVTKLGAENSLKTGTAMGFVPFDVAFHHSSMRMKEQLDWLLKTKAFAKVRELPMVKEAIEKIHHEWQNNKDFTAARRFLQVKENQQLVAMLGDMVSDEIFVTGGANVTEFVNLLGTIFGSAMAAPMSALMEGHFDQESQNKARIQAVLEALKDAAAANSLHIPDFAIGFHIKDKDVAKAQLSRLENLLNFGLGFVPALKGKLKRAETAGGDFLTFTLDGQMVPWKEIPIKEFEEDPGDFDDLVKYLKNMKLTIGLGIKGDYVLLSFGESLKFVESMGQGKSLADRDEIKVLAPHAGNRLASVSYTSKALRVLSTGETEKKEESLEETIGGLLGFLDVSEEKREKLIKDLKAMIADFEKFQAKPGATVACSYLTEGGQESFSYDYSVYPTQDASKPLTLTHHLGGQPILGYVSRSKMGMEQWNTLVKWTKVAWKHVDDLAVAKLPEDWQEKYKDTMTWLGPLLGKFETTTRTKLLPALADSQFGIVLDGTLTSKQWFAQMPAADQPVPAPELGLLWGVSDAQLLKGAFQEYRQQANDLLGHIVEIAGGLIPDVKIPEPKTQTLSEGKAYFYALPENEEVGLDKQIQPAAGLSERAACLALSIKHVERLLKPSPLNYGKDLPFDLNRPASSTFVFDHLALQDALRPWLDYGLKQAMAQGDDAQKDEVKKYGPQIKTILECTRIFRRHVSMTYVENGVTVTRSFTAIKDID